jgi:hypothetical protein
MFAMIAEVKDFRHQLDHPDPSAPLVLQEESRALCGDYIMKWARRVVQDKEGSEIRFRARIRKSQVVLVGQRD